jgi:hypothetical protein
MRENRRSYKFLKEELEGKRSGIRSKRRWENNIKIDPHEIR